jgi:hypothetical protein
MNILSSIDLIVGTLIFVGAIAFGRVARFSWISPQVMTAFLAYKLIICVGYNVTSPFGTGSNDNIGYFFEGKDYARMLGDLFRGAGTEYLKSTPFFGLDGTNTERFTSLAGFLLVITGESFIGCNMVMGLVGGVGQLLVFRYLRGRFQSANHRWFYLILFHPTLTFWSASMVKDSIGVFAVGIAIFYIDDFMLRFRFSSLAAAVFGFYAASLFRPYVLLFMGIYLLSSFWDRRLDNSGRMGGVVTVPMFAYLCTAGVVALAALVYSVRSFGSDFAEAQRISDEGYSLEGAGSTFKNAELVVSAGGLAALPIGLINSFFRPFPWEVRSVTQLLAAIENVIILILFWRAWRKYFFEMPPAMRYEVRSLLFSGALTSVICGSGIGLFCSNAGTISRYRVSVMPIFLAGPCLVMALSSPRRRFPTVPRTVGRGWSHPVRTVA